MLDDNPDIFKNMEFEHFTNRDIAISEYSTSTTADQVILPATFIHSTNELREWLRSEFGEL